MKIVFMGTPEFAVPSLERLASGDDELAAVVTQPDRRKGRGLELKPSPVKECAIKHGLKVLQPERASEPGFISELKSISPELIAVVAYGQILGAEILNIPPHGCINVHASLLPRYRGAAPINRVIMAGDTETGITTMLLDEGMDTGGILLQRRIPIDPDDTAGSLHDKLAKLGADLLMDTISSIKEGTLKPVKQDEGLASYAPPLEKSDGRIDWSLPAEDIRNRIRGMNPWPGAFTEFHGKTIKIFHARTCSGKGQPGEIIAVDDEGIAVACGRGALKILELQPAGKRRMNADEFARGHRIEQGDSFG